MSQRRRAKKRRRNCGCSGGYGATRSNPSRYPPDPFEAVWATMSGAILLGGAYFAWRAWREKRLTRVAIA